MSAETIMSLRRAAQAGGPAGLRAKIILLAHQGRTDVAIAAELGIARQTVARWRRRFEAAADGAAPDGAAVLADAPRSGRPPAPELPVLLATATAPPEGGWSAAGLATRLGLSAATVRRVWRRWGVVVHRDRARSESGVLAGEIERFAGIYLNGGDGAFAYWLRAGEPATPDPAAAGVFDPMPALLAAAEARDECFPERRDLEFEQFLDQLQASRPGGAVLRVVVSDPAMTDSDVIMDWVGRPDVRLGPPPASAKWPVFLAAVVAAVLGPESEPSTGTRIAEQIERLRRSAPDDREPIRWLA
ncbi:helix-turn-helix domain-containing protein [Microlunatus sp. GCM10028923]|uniref:helix-turn-helix domain-containing protein n=1 Tax=Microlunatus sp. GCM10028923 TaxID=3273400 RepID=UPI00361A17C0